MAIKIMLDAGHYTNYNQSKVFKSYYEGNMVWKLQSYLKKELEEYGFTVSTTRTNRDKDKALYDRGYMAKGYDVFLSLHSNACDNESVDRVVIIKGYDQKDTLASKFGKAITEVMGVKQAYQIYTKKNSSGGEYYGVLRGAKAAGVANRFILEHGFHTNTKTAKWLYNDENIKKLAIAEAKVLADHYGYKKKTNTSKEEVYRIIANSLNVRKGAGTKYEIVGTVKKGSAYTIVEKKNGFGKLKSGAGWISLGEKYVELKK